MHIFYSHLIDSVFSVCVQGSEEKMLNTMSLGLTSKNLVLKVNFGIAFKRKKSKKFMKK